jgi:hypothetical protein
MFTNGEMEVGYWVRYCQIFNIKTNKIVQIVQKLYLKRIHNNTNNTSYYISFFIPCLITRIIYNIQVYLYPVWYLNNVYYISFSLCFIIIINMCFMFLFIIYTESMHDSTYNTARQTITRHYNIKCYSTYRYIINKNMIRLTEVLKV